MSISSNEESLSKKITFRQKRYLFQTKMSSTISDRAEAVEIIPGTEIIYDLNGNNFRHRDRTQKAILVPQPSEDTEDPLVSGQTLNSGGYWMV
jgi:hypothetical protein